MNPGAVITENSSSGTSSYPSNYGGGVYVGSGTFTMSGGTISGNSSSYSGGVYVGGNGTFAMSSNARIDPSNEVCLGYTKNYLNGSSSYTTSYAAITIAGNFGGSDTIAVINLRGAASDWLWKSVLLKDDGYTGTIPVSRFSPGNFVNTSYLVPIKTLITSYVINGEGKLVNK
jgi:hypothetical protein